MGGKIRGIGIPIAMWLLGFFKDVGRTCNYSRTISHTIHTHTIYICMYTCVCADDDMYYIYISIIFGQPFPAVERVDTFAHTHGSIIVSRATHPNKLPIGAAAREYASFAHPRRRLPAHGISHPVTAPLVHLAQVANWANLTWWSSTFVASAGRS